VALLVKISLCGDGGVGKTSLRNRYLGRGFESDYVPTIGTDFVSKQVILNHGFEPKKIRFQIWDLAGQPTFRSVRALYYKHAVGAFLVYDITRPDTLFSLDKWMNELSKHSGSSDISVIVLGNKSDLQDESQDRVKSEEARKYISGELIAEFDNINENVIYFETSAKTGENVREAFHELGLTLYNKYKT
jgi:small GTP-binding protein